MRRPVSVAFALLTIAKSSAFQLLLFHILMNSVIDPKSSNCFVFNCKTSLCFNIHKTLYIGDTEWVKSTFPNFFRHCRKWLAWIWNQINCFWRCQHPFAPGGLVHRDPVRVMGLIHSSAGGAVQRLEAGAQVSNLSGHKPCGSAASHVSVLNGNTRGGVGLGECLSPSPSLLHYLTYHWQNSDVNPRRGCSSLRHACSLCLMGKGTKQLLKSWDIQGAEGQPLA